MEPEYRGEARLIPNSMKRDFHCHFVQKNIHFADGANSFLALRFISFLSNVAFHNGRYIVFNVQIGKTTFHLAPRTRLNNNKSRHRWATIARCRWLLMLHSSISIVRHSFIGQLIVSKVPFHCLPHPPFILINFPPNIAP